MLAFLPFSNMLGSGYVLDSDYDMDPLDPKTWFGLFSVTETPL